MNRRFRIATAIVALALPLAAGGFIIQERATRDGARLFDQVMGLVSERFVDTVGAGALYEKAARGLLEQLEDPYSELYTPRQLAEFTQNTGGRYGGLGMQIEEITNRGVSVMKVFPNTPAERAGVQAGDVIVGIDTADTRGWKSAQVSNVLKGEPGSSVNVSFGRPGVPQPLRMTLTRAVIHIPAVPFTLTYDGPNGDIGYVRLEGFSETSAEEFSRAVSDLQRNGAKGIVIDLRENPGGYLEQALNITNLFLQPGQEILSVRGRSTPAQTYVARGRPLAPTVPLVVLIDGRSASASEIVAGALQDHDRALVVGQTSFGKGLVQTLFNLDGGYAVKLTTAKWFTPVGRSIQKERRLGPDGRWVEEFPDSLPADSLRKLRPEYKSAGGRTVYGGGAITPDIIVEGDTLSTAEQELTRALAPKIQEFYQTVAGYAYEMKGQVARDFTVQQAWRDELYRRLERAGLAVDRGTWDRGIGFVDYWLERRIAETSFSQADWQRRNLERDPQFRTALEALRKGATQRDLFAIARNGG